MTAVVAAFHTSEAGLLTCPKESMHHYHLIPLPPATAHSCFLASNPESTSPRRHLFAGIEERSAQATFRIRVQFLEIYNEDVKDLLSPGAGGQRPISVRETPDGAIHVVGSREEEVACYEDLVRLVHLGSLCRWAAGGGCWGALVGVGCWGVGGASLVGPAALPGGACRTAFSFQDAWA